MHILMIAPEAIPVPPIRGGSVETCMYQIAKRLKDKHRITLVGRSHPAYPAQEQRDGIEWIRVKPGPPSVYIRRVLRKLSGRSFDLIQIDNRPKFIKLVKAKFPSVPVALFLHSVIFVNPPYHSRSGAARDLKTADTVVANSRSLRARLKRISPQARIRYVHLGADLDQFRPPTARQREQARSKFGLSGKEVVLFAGRIIPRKGIPVLIRAVKELRADHPQIALAIAGSAIRPAYKRSLQAMARKHGVPVHFLGYIPRNRMHEAYWAADVFACPSQKHEAFGLVVAEAGACGVPSVASRIGGLPEIIRHRHNGLLVVNYRSPSSFAKQIRLLLENKSLRDELSRNARQDIAFRFSWRATAEALSNLYTGHPGTGGE